MPFHGKPKDWTLLFALGVMWGSSFMFNKLAVAGVPPMTVVAARVTIAALLLLAVVRVMRLSLPPPGPVWIGYTVLGIVGNALPFFLITWGQQVVSSAVAGILMATMPLTTLVLAHFFVAGEHMTRNRLSGFVLGFGGIVMLMGPAALSGLDGPAMHVISQLAVLGGALCYAANSVVARRTVASNFLVASAGTLVVAAAVILPLALVLERPWALAPCASCVMAIVWLGIGPTAVATVCYFALISSAGPSFMSLVNYLSPLVAVLCGVTLMGEHPGSQAYIALVLILSGIALSQLRTRPRTAPMA
jgi:drug/metabolite transporter (DMT)-like permease